jgi:hypothetical protein
MAAAAGAPPAYNGFADLDTAKSLIEQVQPPEVTGPVPNRGPANLTYTNAIDAVRNYILALQDNPEGIVKPNTGVPTINEALALIEKAQNEMLAYANNIDLEEDEFNQRMQTFIDKMENLHLPLDTKVIRHHFESIRQDELLSQNGNNNNNNNNNNDGSIASTVANNRSVGGRRRRKRSTRKSKRKARKTRRR